MHGIDLEATLRALTYLGGDPTFNRAPGLFERATLTPDGPATMQIRGVESVAVAIWGPGASWLGERLDGLLGFDDDVSGFSPDHPQLRELWRRRQGLRVARTGTLWHDIAWFIVQQRVRTGDAALSWRSMIRSWGAAAPGPLDLLVPPTAAEVARHDYSDFHQFGIERSRAENLIRAARGVARIGTKTDLDFEVVQPRLAAIRGVGPWTQAGVQSMTWGDADAVMVGDAGIPSMVSWFFANERFGTDERLLELLEPYRPHRLRVVQLLFGSGVAPPRRGPARYGSNDIRRR